MKTKKKEENKWLIDLKNKLDKLVNDSSKQNLKELEKEFGDKETIEVTIKDLVELNKDINKGVVNEIIKMADTISKYIKKNYVSIDKLKKEIKKKAKGYEGDKFVLVKNILKLIKEAQK